MSEEIELNQSGSVLTVALNRPEVHNALAPEMIARLIEIFSEMNGREDVRVVLLTGNGRTFCAGADLSQMLAAGQMSFDDNVRSATGMFDLMVAIEQCDKPVVARVNGSAIGGGVGLVSSCDVAIAVSRAKFGFSEVRLGVVPAMISPFVLRKIGLRNSRELFLTGERFSAEQAKVYGLVHYVVEEAEFDEQVQKIVSHLLMGAPGAQAAIKQLLRFIENEPIENTREYTTHLIASRRESAEGLEGISAFLQKRNPAWQEKET